MRRLSLLAVGALCSLCAVAQLNSADKDTLTHFKGSYEVELTATVSDQAGKSPFWLISNRGGLGSIDTDFGFVRGAAHAMGSINKHWSWNAGVDLAGSWRTEAPFLVRELYGAIRYRDFQLTVGSKLTSDRLVDQKLSSGDLLFSGNALPIPQAMLAMPDYMYIPGTKNWFGFKAFFSVGMYTDGNWQQDWVNPEYKYHKDVLYHSKGIRFKIGNLDKFPVDFEGGLEMAAQFGGKEMRGDTVLRRFPHGFKDFLKIVIPEGGSENAPTGEQTNVLGNHVGEWSARLNWHRPLGGNSMLSLYYLHYFEDHSMMFFDYLWHDGLWGVEAKLPDNPFLTKFVYEYMYTKDQAGPVYWDKTPEIPEQVSGLDDYYNHGVYGGWSHWGMGIGNPLPISPLWNNEHSVIFNCTRVITHHFGLSGDPTPQLNWRFLASYTRGWGRYWQPYPLVRNNINFLAEANWHPKSLNGWSGTLSLGLDHGSMVGHNLGAMFTIRKTGIL